MSQGIGANGGVEFTTRIQQRFRVLSTDVESLDRRVDIAEQSVRYVGDWNADINFPTLEIGRAHV